MPWTYSQSTGKLTNGEKTFQGYSGRGDARNKPEREAEVDVGPIPRGRYLMGIPFDSAVTTPFAIPLTPQGHNAHGRTAFQIHGDKAGGNASKGCIILSPIDSRVWIWSSCDHFLDVVR